MASLPAFRMGGEPMVCDISEALTPPLPPQASSSASTMRWNTSQGVPPYCSG